MSGRWGGRGGLAPSVLLLLSVSIVAAACASDRSRWPQDNSFLTGNPCLAPCWYGLELGRSDSDQVMATLSTLPFVVATSIISRPTGWYDSQDAMLIEYECVGQQGESCGGALVSEGTLVRITLPVQVPITFREAVNRLGQPDFVFAGPPAVSGGCAVSLFFRASQAIVSSHQRGDKICERVYDGQGIDPELLLDSITYVTANVMPPGEDSGPPFFPWPGFLESDGSE